MQQSTKEIIWEETNSTEVGKKCLNNNGQEPNDITNVIKNDSTNNQCNDIGKKSTRKKFRTRYTEKEPYRWLYTILTLSAKNENKQFDLTFDEFLEFTKIKQCHYCNVQIYWPERSRYRNKHGKLMRYSQSYYLDRKDNKIGYFKDNCVVCCSLCNKIKRNTLSYNEMNMLREGINMIQKTRFVSDKSDTTLK